MIVIPALDLKAGACVQAAGSGPPRHTDDAIAAAREFSRCGYQRLHVSDLDAVAGRQASRDSVRHILFASGSDVQLRDGARTSDDVSEALASGARYVVVGSEALERLDWLEETVELFSGEVVVAVDVRQRSLLVRGWSRARVIAISDLVDELRSLPLAGLLVNDVERQRAMIGPDLQLMEDLAEECPFDVLAAGGIASIAQLRALEDRGIAGAVVGKAFYTGVLSPYAVYEEFAA